MSDNPKPSAVDGPHGLDPAPSDVPTPAERYETLREMALILLGMSPDEVQEDVGSDPTSFMKVAAGMHTEWLRLHALAESFKAAHTALVAAFDAIRATHESGRVSEPGAEAVPLGVTRH